jgi:branched-chain amino acid transport system ATP-binding protein
MTRFAVRGVARRIASPPREAGAHEPLLACRKLSVGYGDLAAARDLDLEVAAGEIVAMVGPNGAGKTTTLLTLVGELKPISGEVAWNGAVSPAPLHVWARRGIAFIPEERSVCSGMSGTDNLRVAGVSVADALRVFPELEPVLAKRAGLLSGGQQQMLTLARAIARKPRLIVVDELSQGLAPIIADRLVTSLRAYADGGGAVLVVEQNLRRALTVSDRFYVLTPGGLVMAGKSRDYDDRLNLIETQLLPS